ncbi:lmo0937 family membrane protein [Bacillus norwichensis]|uniref:Lmo0937 family membrane protein n=1 Tax=Bacillus norwichensis TaxID=2762217 RepID=A0ABR8VM05_9BACI|nr:lmo0937 family membrane protein [Bacillus norwichensis]MBD8005794.1 lmo0937 family membrane protein [Bacillus norwichensis]
MLWTIIGILIVLWILGLVAKIGGALIHILLVAAVIIFIVYLVMRRNKAR